DLRTRGGITIAFDESAAWVRRGRICVRTHNRYHARFWLFLRQALLQILCQRSCGSLDVDVPCETVRTPLAAASVAYLDPDAEVERFQPLIGVGKDKDILFPRELLRVFQ